jgi:hypothetical protein
MGGIDGVFLMPTIRVCFVVIAGGERRRKKLFPSLPFRRARSLSKSPSTEALGTQSPDSCT